ncbi:MAG: restriction endonuclease subunit S [Tannerella sp.]|jgi:type I restriction enzyme S subunit|nr:restriction endonuclease subunit S [Tannerella sp.]
MKEGKDTEFGLIPLNWTIATFGELLDGFTSGATPYRAIPSFYNGDILWISSGELNYNWITETLEHISAKAKIETNLKEHPVGTFLMAITGLEAEGTRGRCAFVGKPATTNQSCMAIYPTSKLITEYLFYFYRQYANYLAFKYCQGTKQQSYTAKIVKQLPICCPCDVKEQQAIANALSDIDVLINALNKQIKKKKNIKQGAMRELLTGKKRLQGFTGKWEEKTLEELLSYEQPTKYIVKSTEYITNGIPVLTPGKSFILGYTNEDSGIFNDIPIILFDDFITSSKFVNFPFKVKSSALKILKIRNKSDNIYLIYNIIQTIKFPLNDHQRYWISEYSKLIIFLPPTKEEQNAIAQVLTDMDNEIAQLEKKRDKYLQIKSGMMQQLLTGQIRLIDVTSNTIEEVKVVPIDKKKHSKQFDEAIIISFLVDRFGTAEEPLSRFMYTKLSYFIHRKHDCKVVDYNKFAAGPYNPKARYGGSENIGEKNRYFTLVKNAKGYDAFVPQENIQEAVDYFTQWYGLDIQNWVEQFRQFKPWILETLATVDMAVCDLEEKGIDATVSTIKTYLASIPKWKAKLDKSHFSDIHIQNAINESIRLFKI